MAELNPTDSTKLALEDEPGSAQVTTDGSFSGPASRVESNNETEKSGLPPLVFKTSPQALGDSEQEEDILAEGLRPFWRRNLLMQASDKERLRLGNAGSIGKKVTNPREAIGVDLYAAQGLAKAFKISTLEELFLALKLLLEEK